LTKPTEPFAVLMLDDRLANILSELRRQIRRYAVLETLLFCLIAVFGWFFLGWLIDFIPTRWGGLEMPRAARAAMLGLLLIGLLTGVWRFWLRRRIRRLPDESLALLIERSHPNFGGRLLTAVQLIARQPLESAESQDLLRVVHSQAASHADEIDLRRVFRWKPLAVKLAIAIPLFLSLTGLLVAKPGWAKQAWARMLLLTDEPWPRRARLEVVGLELQKVELGQDTSGANTSVVVPFEQGEATLARGQAAVLRILAQDAPFQVPEACTLRYRSADGQRGEANLRRVGRVKAGAQSFALEGPPLDSIQSDLELSIRGLDARIDGLRVKVVDPPVVERLTLIQRLPAYLVAADDRLRSAEYRPGLRIAEGAEVVIRGTTNRPVQSVKAFVQHGDAEGTLSDATLIDNGNAFELQLGELREPVLVELLPSFDGISSLAASRYTLNVLPDEQPSIELQFQGIGTAITPIAKLPLKGSANDDHGLNQADLLIAPDATKADETIRLPLTVDQQNRVATVVDLKELSDSRQMPALQPGTQVAVLGEVTDYYNLGSSHVARSVALQRDVVTAEDLLSLLQKNELILRGRLEQIIGELKQVRESLRELERLEGGQNGAGTAAVATLQPPAASGVEESVAQAESQTPSAQQLARLRLQQAALQVDKSSSEVDSIVVSIDELIAEMENNRLDTVERMNRLVGQVQQPLQRVALGDLRELRGRLGGSGTPRDVPTATEVQQTGQLTEQVLLQLEAVLANMLDMEDYNEVLELVRSLLEDQQKVIEATKAQQSQRVLELFE